LRTRVVQVLMNTINSLQSRHHLSRENAQLRGHLLRYNDLSNQNILLHNELSHYRQKTEENTALSKQLVTRNQQPQHKPISSDLITENHQPPHANTNSHPVASQHSLEMEEEEALRAEVDHYREKNAELLERYAKLNEEMKRKKIDSFEALAEYDKEAMKVLIELARLTEPIPLEGINIGLFGSTSTGKSTMLNALLGQKVAETGVGETTTKITPYSGTKFTFWDVPGRNDEVSYLSMEYISFFKGLTQRLILIQATVKENSSMMKLLDEIGLQYDIVFNKFDKVEQEEQAEVQQQIRSEVERIGLKGVNKIYFVSAKNPKMFDDWMAMVNNFENA